MGGVGGGGGGCGLVSTGDMGETFYPTRMYWVVDLSTSYTNEVAET